MRGSPRGAGPLSEGEPCRDKKSDSGFGRCAGSPVVQAAPCHLVVSCPGQRSVAVVVLLRPSVAVVVLLEPSVSVYSQPPL